MTKRNLKDSEKKDRRKALERKIIIILSALVPVAGVLMYFAYYNVDKEYARKCKNAFIIGFLVNIGIYSYRILVYGYQ